MRAHIVDPNLPLTVGEDLDHLQGALDEGRITISSYIPQDRPFDAAYIASPTGTHMESLARTRNMSPEMRPMWTILEKPAVSGKVEEGALRMFLRRGLVTGRIYVHEPYLLSEGLQRMQRFITEQRDADNPPLDIRVWSVEDRTPDVARGRTGNEQELGAFGVEFPHTHAAAGMLAGVELGREHVHADRNIYYKGVNGKPTSEGTYTEFVYEGALIRVAQGLGPFMMTSKGELMTDPKPGITRAAEATFADGQRVHLNLRPAVDRYGMTKAHPYRHSVWSRYDASGDQLERDFIPDYPIKKLITNVLDKLRDPETPSLPGIDIVSSLARCMAVRTLREHTKIKSGVQTKA